MVDINVPAIVFSYGIIVYLILVLIVVELRKTTDPTAFKPSKHFNIFPTHMWSFLIIVIINAFSQTKSDIDPPEFVSVIGPVISGFLYLITPIIAGTVYEKTSKVNGIYHISDDDDNTFPWIPFLLLEFLFAAATALLTLYMVWGKDDLVLILSIVGASVMQLTHTWIFYQVFSEALVATYPKVIVDRKTFIRIGSYILYLIGLGLWVVGIYILD